MSDFSGIWVPVVTPFSPSGELDLPALQRVVAQCVTGGVSGLVALGTTGEAAALSAQEQDAVFSTVLQAAQGLPVMVGISGHHLSAMREQMQRWHQAAGFLCAAPAYVRPSQAGLLDWFTQLADAAPAPLVLYDIPARTGVRMELATLLALAAHPNIRAVKDVSGSLATTQALIADGRLQVLAGDDFNIFFTLCMGGSGAIAASAQVRPDLFVGMARAVQDHDLAQARELFHPLCPLVAALFEEPNPGPVKAALALQGLISDGLRAPMTVASAALRERLGALLATLPAAAPAKQQATGGT